MNVVAASVAAIVLFFVTFLLYFTQTFTDSELVWAAACIAISVGVFFALRTRRPKV